MPPKIRELITELEQAGFRIRRGKGNHPNDVHLRLSKPVTISGKLSDDARPYRIRAVRAAITEFDQ
jgi:predicted RNA binding protein YcfA (HicA-like mRNA interferase family)